MACQKDLKVRLKALPACFENNAFRPLSGRDTTGEKAMTLLPVAAPAGQRVGPIHRAQKRIHPLIKLNLDVKRQPSNEFVIFRVRARFRAACQS